MNIYGVDKMWRDLIKQLQPANKHHGFAFRTSVDFQDTTYEEDRGWADKQKAIIKWEFSFGQRETYMREIGIYVTGVILPDEAELSDEEIEKINTDSPDEVYGKLGPSELVKYEDGNYELTWSQ